MTTSDPELSAVGRVKTAIVFGQGDSAQGTLCVVSARVRKRNGGKRLRFSGPVVPAPEVSSHLSETVLAVADAVLVPLGQPKKAFDVALANPSAASALDLGTSISGFSADLAFLLAILSSALRIPVPQNLVVTGHVASPAGDIGPVGSLSAKLAAASGDLHVGRFICPSLDTDGSLETLAPAEKERLSSAIAGSGDGLRVSVSEDVAELLQAVFPKETVVLASLRGDFFDGRRSSSTEGGPIDSAVRFLAGDNEKRFWAAMESYFFAGAWQPAKRLLAARVRHSINRKRYPRRLGSQLLSLVCSLPPGVRRLSAAFPLLPAKRCLRLGRLASGEDVEDVHCLLDAVRGKASAPPSVPSPDGRTARQPSEGMDRAVDLVLREVSAESLAQTIGLSIDTARAAFTLEEVTTTSYDTFHGSITAFYTTAQRHAGMLRDSTADATMAVEAVALTERAFAKKGGLEAAWAEAQQGAQGGMRFVLDVLADQLKDELQRKHVNRVLKEALDPLDWDARVAFMAVMMERLGPFLPPQIRAAPPERYARHYEEVVRAYVGSFDQVNRLLRAL